MDFGCTKIHKVDSSNANSKRAKCVFGVLDGKSIFDMRFAAGKMHYVSDRQAADSD